MSKKPKIAGIKVSIKPMTQAEVAKARVAASKDGGKVRVAAAKGK